MAVTTSELPVAADGQAIGTLESFDPATGELLGTVPVTGPEGVNAAVGRARETARSWTALSHAERRHHLQAFRREIASRVDDIAELIHRENGKTRLDAVQEVLAALVHLDHATKRADKALKPQKVSSGLFANMRATITYHPFGVIGVIGPWNYPIFTPMGSIGYALAAGNCAVFKPSELTPLVGQALADAAAASLPSPYILQVVTGDGRTGAALASAAVDKLAFTGSAATGRRVMEAAAKNLTPVVLELGGKDPMIVAADADVDKAAKSAVFGALTNAGQACVSIERAYVVEPVYEHFVEAAVEAARQVRVGSGDDDHVGAITRPQQLDIIREHIVDALDKGAKALVGGRDAVGERFVQPTVLVDVTPDMKIMQDETFGPVLPIIKVANAEEAIEEANETSFGLGSSVWGRAGVRRLADRVRSGMTSVNSVMAFSMIPSLPFGGVGESGFGRIHGDEGLREFSRVKAIAEEKFSFPLLALGFGDDQGKMAQQLKGFIKAAFGTSALDKVDDLRRKLPF